MPASAPLPARPSAAAWARGPTPAPIPTAAWTGPAPFTRYGPAIAPKSRSTARNSSSERNVDGEHARAPVGQPGGDGTVWTDQRRQPGEVLIGGRARLAGHGDPQSASAGVPDRVAQAAPLPPAQARSPGGLGRAASVQPGCRGK